MTEKTTATDQPTATASGVGRALRALTGVNETILARAEAEAPRYSAMGGVVLGTAIMAAVSMTVALVAVFGRFHWYIVVAVVVWGGFILSLDRWLMSTTTMSDAGSAARKLVPRLLLSIALGVVVAEPILLGIYHTAIEERAAKDRTDEIDDRATVLRDCNPTPTVGPAATNPATLPSTPSSASPSTGPAATATARPTPATSPTGARCAGSLLNIQNSPVPTEKKLIATQDQLATLRTQTEADAAEYARLESLARKECVGTKTDETTGVVGEGRECRDLRRQASAYRADHHIVENEQKEVDLNNEIITLTGQLAKERADYDTAVSLAIDQELQEVRGRQKDLGILERFRTLDALVTENGYVHATQWALRIFFIIVDALPVLIKVMTGVTEYDRRVHEEQRVGRELDRIRNRTRVKRVVEQENVNQYRDQREAVTARDRIDLKQALLSGRRSEERGRLISERERDLLRAAIGPAVEGEPDIESTLEIERQRGLFWDDASDPRGR